MACIAGSDPCAALLSVARLTNKQSGSWSRVRALGCSLAYMGGSSTSGRSKGTWYIYVMITYFFGLCVLLVMVLDGPGHQESTAGPITVPLSPPIAAQKIIRDSKA